VNAPDLVVPKSTEEDRAAYAAARTLHEVTPEASVAVARQMRNMLQPLQIYAHGRKEIVALVDRLTALAQSLEGH
jgi:hypothetical protein